PSSVWSEQWTGTLHPTTTGPYQFSMTCDRSCELLVNGTRIIDNNGASDLITHHTSTGRIGLTAGQAVRIKVTYAQTWEGSGKQKLGTIAQLGWLPPGSTPPSVAAAAAAAKSAQAAVVFAGTFESEGFDQPNL